MACGNGVLTAYGEENKEADDVQEDILIQAPAGILIEADTGGRGREKKPCQHYKDHDSSTDL